MIASINGYGQDNGCRWNNGLIIIFCLYTLKRSHSGNVIASKKIGQPFLKFQSTTLPYLLMDREILLSLA